MKLLFDHNLPPLLVSRLADLFPQSQHVFALGLDRASDWEIRDYARRSGYFVVTKDADFSRGPQRGTRAGVEATSACCWVFRPRSFGFVEETVQQKRLKIFCDDITTTLWRWKQMP